MNGVNKTLYIPLYGKASVSKKGIILKDKKAEMIWEKEGFPLKGKAKSKWLTYYMGMRSAVFDSWVKEKLEKYPSASVLYIVCGMDSYSWIAIRNLPQEHQNTRTLLIPSGCRTFMGLMSQDIWRSKQGLAL